MTNDELRRAYAAGTPARELAEQCGITYPAMRNRLYQIGARRKQRTALERACTSPAALAIRAELAHGPATSAALAGRLAYTHGTIQVMLSHLRRAGIVRRVGDQHWRIV